jgi:hypothetical protein
MNEIVKSFTEELDALCEGLLLMSETDAPLKSFEWKKSSAIDENIVKTKLKVAPEAALETLSVEDFLKISVTPQDWHGEIEKKSAEGFQQIATFLSQKLKEVKVFKTTGNARRDVVVVGLTENGTCAGFKTYTVET